MSLHSKLAPDRYRENEYDLLLTYTLTRYSLIYSIDRVFCSSQQITQLIIIPVWTDLETAIPVNDRILWLL